MAIEQVGNFVRLQGALGGPGNPNGRLFTIPFEYRPTDTVFVTAALVPENRQPALQGRLRPNQHLRQR